MPEMTPEKMIERLAGPEPVPAILLRGTDPYLRELYRKKIIELCVPREARDWALTRVSTEDAGWDEVLGRAQTMPMLAARQVVIAENAESLEEMDDEARDEITAALAAYFASPAPFTVLLIEAAQLDRRLKVFKLLSEQALIVDLNIGAESAASLAEQMAAELGAKIERLAAVELADILDHQPARMHVELEKLAVYAQGRESITVADVRAIVVSARKNSVWQLADMLASRQREAALAFLDNILREGETPASLVGGLAWAYRRLIAARELPATMNGFQASRILGANPQAAETALRNAHRFSKRDLIAGLVALAEADSALKFANPNPRAYMEFLIARLTSGSASTAA
ncbi:MAG: DNA polymerase III subunit delta [Candidatus Acidiferrales bacterium]